MTPPAEESRRFPTRGRPLAAFVDGWNRTLHAPIVTLGLIVATPVVAMLTSLAGPVAWRANLVDRVTQSTLGGNAVLVRLSDWIDTAPHTASSAFAIVVSTVFVLFLTGGVLDRLARARPVGAAAFFSACGGYTGRLIRLSIPFVPLYWCLIAPVRDRLDDVSLVWAFPLLVGAVDLVSDLARVRLVVEDRRSALGAIAASLRFIRRCFWRVCGLYLLNVVTMVAAFEVFELVAPYALGSDVRTSVVVTLSLLARVWLWLACGASEIAFFQAELAHAGYSARPLPMWPDSPSAEGLRNLVLQRPEPGSPKR